MSNSCDPMTLAHQASLSMELSRQEYWSGLSFPSPGDLSNPGIKSPSPALRAHSLLTEPPGIQDYSEDFMIKCMEKAKHYAQVFI